MVQVVFARRWTNVSLQQVQPNVSIITDSHDDAGDDVHFTADEAFHGGGCLQVSASHDHIIRFTVILALSVICQRCLH